MDVGVDVGTTVTKAVAFDDGGRPVAEASRPTRLVRSGIGRFEHETAEIVASVNEVVGELAGTVGDRPGVLAITAQGDGLWLVDPDGTAVRPAISWLDARSSAILERWTADGIAESVWSAAGRRTRGRA
jgi:erythritol kinase